MEELLLGLGLAGEELDVVDQQHVGVAVGVLEAVDRAGAERGDEVVGERLGGRVADGGAAAEGEHVVADRVQEVGLAEPRRGVEEERVVGLARKLGDGEGGRVGEAVAVADDELLEAVAGVERNSVRLDLGSIGALWLRGDPEARSPANVNCGFVAEDRAQQRLEHAAVALGDPRPGVGRRARASSVLPSQELELERGEPDVVGGVADEPAELGADRRARQG